MEALKKFLRKNERLAYTIPSAIVATVFGLTLGFAQGCRNAEKKNNKGLLRRALVKADINKDGTIQYNEANGLLKKVGCRDIVHPKTYLSVETTRGRTRVRYYGDGDCEDVLINESDLRKYLGEK